MNSFLEQVTGFLTEHGLLDGLSCSPPKKRLRSVSVQKYKCNLGICAKGTAVNEHLVVGLVVQKRFKSEILQTNRVLFFVGFGKEALSVHQNFVGNNILKHFWNHYMIVIYLLFLFL